MGVGAFTEKWFGTITLKEQLALWYICHMILQRRLYDRI